MKAVTLIQPWATMIAEGLKEYETRSWQTAYRGPLAIHAGLKTWPGIGYGLPQGVVLAVADLVDVGPTDQVCWRLDSDVELACGDWTPGRFAWRLANVRKLSEPVSMRGDRGVFDVAAPIREAILQQLEVTA